VKRTRPSSSDREVASKADSPRFRCSCCRRADDERGSSERCPSPISPTRSRRTASSSSPRMAGASDRRPCGSTYRRQRSRPRKSDGRASGYAPRSCPHHADPRSGSISSENFRRVPRRIFRTAASLVCFFCFAISRHSSGSFGPREMSLSLGSAGVSILLTGYSHRKGFGRVLLVIPRKDRETDWKTLEHYHRLISPFR